MFEGIGLYPTFLLLPYFAAGILAIKLGNRKTGLSTQNHKILAFAFEGIGLYPTFLLLPYFAAGILAIKLGNRKTGLSTQNHNSFLIWKPKIPYSKGTADPFGQVRCDNSGFGLNTEANVCRMTDLDLAAVLK